MKFWKNDKGISTCRHGSLINVVDFAISKESPSWKSCRRMAKSILQQQKTFIHFSFYRNQNGRRVLRATYFSGGAQ